MEARGVAPVIRSIQLLYSLLNTSFCGLRTWLVYRNWKGLRGPLTAFASTKAAP